MNWLFLYTIVVCFPQDALTQTTHPKLAFVQIINYSIANPTQTEVSVKIIKKGKSLKKGLLLKWLEKKLKQPKNSKQAGNTMGWVSFVFGILAFIAALIVVFSSLEATFGVFLAVGLVAGIMALIFGIIALIKRSSLKNKAETKAWPALIGIVLTALLAILFAILFV